MCDVSARSRRGVRRVVAVVVVVGGVGGDMVSGGGVPSFLF